MGIFNEIQGQPEIIIKMIYPEIIDNMGQRMTRGGRHESNTFAFRKKTVFSYLS